MDNVPDKYNNTLQDLIADARGSPTVVLLDHNPFLHVSIHNDNISVFIMRTNSLTEGLGMMDDGCMYVWLSLCMHACVYVCMYVCMMMYL